MKQSINLTLKEQVLMAQAIDDRIEELRSRRRDIESSYMYANALDDQIDTLLDIRNKLIEE